MAVRPLLSRWRVAGVLLAVPALLGTLGVAVPSASAVTPAATTTSTASVDPTSVNFGDSVAYTITVTSTAGVVGGNAFFEIEGQVMCGVAALNNGTGTCTSTAAPAGANTVTAVFNGNPVFAGSTATTTLTVNEVPPPPPFGASASATGAGTNDKGSVVVTLGQFVVQGNGPGALTTANYTANPTNVPITTPTDTSTNVYSDVALGKGSGFSSVLVAECNEGAGNSLLFYNGAKWVEFSDQSNSADCLFALVTPSTTPSLSQLGGTPVAVSWLPPPNTPQGYWLAATDGGIFSFNRPFDGSTGSIRLNQPIVGLAPTHDFGGYWLAASDGGVFTFGDAHYFGSLPGELKRTSAVVAIVSNPATSGYYLIKSDGTVWDFHAPSFGDLPFFGYHVNDIVGGASTPDGRGLYLVGADGHVYVLTGDGAFAGDASSLHLNAPIVGMEVDPATNGYWLLGQDGGVFSYNAPFFGSTGNIKLNQPVVGMTVTGDGGGYWFTASDGGVFSYGNARFYGSTGSIRLNKPVVQMGGG
jgi:hypothetical protein